jgi:hypothetical protein
MGLNNFHFSRYYVLHSTIMFHTFASLKVIPMGKFQKFIKLKVYKVHKVEGSSS